MDINKELEKLEKKKEELEKLRLGELVKKNKAFNCTKCKKVVVKDKAGPGEIELKLCYGCLQIKRKRDIKDKILTKIKHGRIIDVELDNFSFYPQIARLTVASHGMMYELRPVDDDGDTAIIIDKEWKEDISKLEDFMPEEIKPWQKERKETPLPL